MGMKNEGKLKKKTEKMGEQKLRKLRNNSNKIEKIF